MLSFSTRSLQALVQAAESELGSDDPLVASHLVHVARLYHDQGKFIEAAEWYERARIVYQSASVEQAKRELGLAWIASQIENCATEESSRRSPLL